MSYRKHFVIESQKILIVDDNPNNIQVLANILKNEGYNIEFAMDGLQALDRLKKSEFDIILLDIMMPKMSGTELCTILRNNSKYDDVPIIFLTANSDKDVLVEGFNLGAQDYIVKPYNADELLVRVATHLELKNKREQLAKVNTELMDMNTTKDFFFSIIAHDLKSPFFVLTTYSEKLVKMVEDHYEPRLTHMVQTLHNASVQGRQLLNNLLHWSMSQTGKLNFSPESFSLSELILAVQDLLKDNAQLKKIKFSNEFDHTSIVRADKNMIKVVLVNLLSNAIKFTSKGGKIKLVITSDDKNAKISVIDSGVGIKEEHIQNIFRIDKKYKTMGTNGEEGSGLGLIVCQEFVLKHGGKIGVESEVGKGTQFFFTIPLDCD